MDTLGHQIDNVDEFVAGFRVNSSGTNVVKMSEDLARQGVDATPHLNLSVTDIAEKTRHGDPVIAHVGHPGPGQAGHFVVVDGVTTRNGKDVIAIRDPHGKQYFEELEVFEARFTGNGLTFGG